MTCEELLSLLDFEENLESVEIKSQIQLAHDATFIVAELEFNPEMVMQVPFIHYSGQDWIFTPYDWQGWLPENEEDIDRIDWRVNDTDTEGIMFDGLPMLAPWVGEIKDATRETRKRIGSRLKESRESQNLSIRTLAEQTGINKSQICRIEAGRLNTGIDTIARLATALGLTLDLD